MCWNVKITLCNGWQKNNWIPILFAYKLCTESYSDSYADSDTCRRPLRRPWLRSAAPTTSAMVAAVTHCVGRKPAADLQQMMNCFNLCKCTSAFHGVWNESIICTFVSYAARLMDSFKMHSNFSVQFRRRSLSFFPIPISSGSVSLLQPALCDHLGLVHCTGYFPLHRVRHKSADTMFWSLILVWPSSVLSHSIPHTKGVVDQKRSVGGIMTHSVPANVTIGVD
jgi:hypothetical protein